MQAEHIFFLEKAVSLAVENVREGNGGPFGAVIVKDNQIIATGVNQVTANNDPTAHAEIVAIRRACEVLKSFQLDGCVLYSSCEPCPMCLGAIYWARPQAVYFAANHKDAADAGFDDSFIYQELELSYNERSIPTYPVPLETRHQAFNLWNDNEKKILY